MGNILLIGIGGFLGAILRYFIGSQAQQLFKSVTFPFGTLVVNVSGCLMIGVLVYLVEVRGSLTPGQRVLLMSGLLGAFTTFSSFSLETLNLINSGRSGLGLVNLLANNLLGLAAVWLGRNASLAIWR